jgi:hypothetical protein
MKRTIFALTLTFVAFVYGAILASHEYTQPPVDHAPYYQLWESTYR